MEKYINTFYLTKQAELKRTRGLIVKMEAKIAELEKDLAQAIKDGAIPVVDTDNDDSVDLDSIKSKPAKKRKVKE